MDLYSQCNEQNLLSERDFVSTFCSKCRNRNCERAGWAKSTWESRISTQVDRLLLNPNIQTQDSSSRWDGLQDIESLPRTGVVEVWGAPSSSSNPSVIVSPISETQEVPMVETPAVPRNFINTPAREIILAPTAPSKARITPPDPWAPPTNKVAVGGTFKMGK